MKRILTLSGAFGFVLFLLVGGLWVSLVNFLPKDIPRGMLTVGLGVAFAGLFLWDMLLRLRHVLSGPDRLGMELGLTALNLLLLLLAFAFVFFQFGIIDTTQPGSPVVAGAGGMRGVLPSDWLEQRDDQESASESDEQNSKKQEAPHESSRKSESRTETESSSPSKEKTFDTARQFALCFYFSVVTFTTLGYGDFQPIGWGRAVAGLEAFVGYLVLGILASSASTLLRSSAQERQADGPDAPD